jgi:hypothetical protein
MISETFGLITFKSTHHAIASEKILLDAGLNIRIIPVPTEITAGCGLSIKYDEADLLTIHPLIAQFDGIRFYHIEQQGFKKTCSLIEL